MSETIDVHDEQKVRINLAKEVECLESRLKHRIMMERSIDRKIQPDGLISSFLSNKIDVPLSRQRDNMTAACETPYSAMQKKLEEQLGVDTTNAAKAPSKEESLFD